MDDGEELAKLKWILIALIGFLISGYYSIRELKYAVWGTIAQATVTRTFETAEMGRRGRNRPLLAVEYTFSDTATGQRSERDDVPLDWPVPSGTVDVQYFPGVADSSRLKGHSSSFAIWIFLACIVGLGYAGYQFHKLAHENDPGQRKRRKR